LRYFRNADANIVTFFVFQKIYHKKLYIFFERKVFASI